MNKKVLVLAIGAALAIPAAYAQKGGGGKGGDSDPDSVVVLYGKVYPEIVRQKGKGATPQCVNGELGAAANGSCTTAQGGATPVATFAAAASGTSSIMTRNEMESSNSRFGVRGHEKLGGGLRAVWQLETIFLADSNNSAFAQRDSWVGLKHDRFGTVKLGRFDTPFKEYGDDISFLGVSSGNFVSTSAVLRRFGFGTSNAARFHERKTNATQYESPDFGPAEFKIQYATDEADACVAGPFDPCRTVRKPHSWSFGGSLEFGPVKVMAGHEVHWDSFGGSANMPVASMRNSTNDTSAHSKDKASEIAATLKLGNHSFEIDWEWHEWKESASPHLVPAAGSVPFGRFGRYKNNSMLALWEARWSPQWRTQIHYVRATAGSCALLFVASTTLPCRTDGLEGRQISAGVAYYFSRRTYLFFLYQQLRNGKSAMFASGTQTPSTGEDVTQYALGLHHSF